MMKQRLAAMRAARGRATRPAARDRDIPLPLNGIFSQAKTAKVSNLFAAELSNMRSTGHSITLRPGMFWDPAPPIPVLQRIPFEFGTKQQYIEVTSGEIRCTDQSILRTITGNVAFTTISNQVLIADGAGDVIRYDGASFQTAAFTAAAGPAPETCDGILSHHDRIYMWKTGGELEFLYGDVGAVMGPLSRFPLGRLGNITGSIQSMQSLSLDAGQNTNDVLCIITTTGQMIIYQGFDPGDEQDWLLRSRIEGAVPLGPRAFTQIGADVWMLTAQGPISINESMQSSILSLSSQVSQPIKDAIVEFIEQGPAEWQAFTAKDGSMVILNRVANGVAQQFIYYLESRSWSTAEIQARDLHNLGGKPEMTSFDGRLGHVWHKGSNEVITGRWVSSWFRLGGEAAVTYIWPTIIAQGPLTVRVVILSNQNDRPQDIVESEQILVLEPEEGGGNRVTLSDIIGSDASGDCFQITLEVTATWAEITNLRAGIA